MINSDNEKPEKLGKPKVAVTKEQFNDYRAVQSEGLYNMLDPRARVLTGLSESVFARCISMYAELTILYGDYKL